MNVRRDSHKVLVHQLAACLPDLSTKRTGGMAECGEAWLNQLAGSASESCGGSPVYINVCA